MRGLTRRNKNMKKRSKIITAAAVCALTVLSLAGCSLAEGLLSGNSKDDIDAALKTLGERYGTTFTLKRKKAVSGGASVNVYATCPETGDREIYVFQAKADSRVPTENAVKTDYIYVKYGAEVLAKITELSEKACPGCKVIVNEREYNHLTFSRYDKNTDLSKYLADNEFDVDVYMPRMLGKTELEAFYHSLQTFLNGEGIYCKELILGCPENFDEIVPPDHILCSNEEQYEGLTGKPSYTYSAYCPNYITKNDVPHDSSSLYMVFIDGQRAK